MSFRFNSGEQINNLLHDSGNRDIRGQAIAQETAMLAPVLSSLGNRTGIDPQTLSDIFTLQAERSGALVTSHFSPISVHDYKEIYKSFDVEKFNARTPIAREDFAMGFLQRARYKNSFTIPVIILSDKMLARVKPHAPEKMLEALADIYTFTNHDYLHHLTSELTVSSFAKTDLESYDTALSHKLNKRFGGDEGGKFSMESFFLLSHASSFQDQYRNNAGFRDKFDSSLETFFVELERIRNRLGHSSFIAGQAHRTSKAVNYFGTSVMFAVDRVFGPEDPIFKKGFERIMEIDPLVKSSQREQGKASVAGKIFAEKKKDLWQISPEIPSLMRDLFNGGSSPPAHIARIGELEKDMIAGLVEDAHTYTSTRPATPVPA